MASLAQGSPILFRQPCFEGGDYFFSMIFHSPRNLEDIGMSSGFYFSLLHFK